MLFIHTFFITAVRIKTNIIVMFGIKAFLFITIRIITFIFYHIDTLINKIN